MIGVRPSREYMVPRLALAAVIGGCVGASIGVWRAGGDHASAISPRTGASVTSAHTSSTPTSEACIPTEAGDPPATAADDTRAGALCEALAFDGVFGSSVRLGPIDYRRVLLEHFAPAANLH